jgi:TonB family protein
MRIDRITALLAILLTPSLALAAPKISTPRMPTGPWNVEFADSMCVLSRPFGNDGLSNLALKPAMLSQDFEIVVTEPARGSREPNSGPVVVTVAGMTKVQDSRFTAYNTSKMRLLRMQVNEKQLALSAVNGTISIEAKDENRHHFAVPGIDRAFPILTRCVDQLREAYKVSKADLAAIATMPEGLLPGLFSTDDYPQEALSKGQYGTVGVLLWVDEAGKVATCEVIEAGAAASLKETTCGIFKRRAKFVPAKGSDGKAIRAPIFTRIQWRLP